MEKAKQTYKNRFFFMVVIQECEKSKKWILSKNCLTLFVSGWEKNAHFRAHYLFWLKLFFGPKQCKAGNTIKIGFSAEIAEKTKNDTCFGRRCFLTWLKKWVLLTVFLKSCVFLKTLFYSVFSSHSFSKTKPVCWKNRKFMKNSGLFLNMAKWCLLGWFFWGFNIIMVCFWCVWHCFKSVENACFPIFGGFSAVAYCCSFGFGRFRCFVFLVFVCLFCVAFVSVLFALLLVLWLDVVVLFFFDLFVLLFFFWRVSGSSEVAQRATSLGPKPSLLLFVFCSFFCVFSFCFVWRV